jgi:hypothetical protein
LSKFKRKATVASPKKICKFDWLFEKKLQIRPWSKNELKLIDFASMHFEKVKSLPTSFNGNIMFELPPIMLSTSTPMQCQIEGMDKKFDGHI